MYNISVEGIECFAYHGCLAEEAKIGGKFSVDVFIKTDFEEAAKNDDLNKTVDYVEVYKIVKEEMAIRSQLIETVATRIAKRLKKDLKGVEAIEVRLIKFNPPVNGFVKQTSVSVAK